MDYRRKFIGGLQQFTHSGAKRVRGDLVALIKQWVDQGAGEVWLNCIEREATYSGYDLGMVEQVSQALTVPLVAIGGAGNVADMRAAIDAGASAVAAGAMFVYQRPHNAVLISYLKEEIFV